MLNNILKDKHTGQQFSCKLNVHWKNIHTRGMSNNYILLLALLLSLFAFQITLNQFYRDFDIT